MASTMTGRAVDSYARPQVALHWVIAILVGAQFLSAGAMETFFDRGASGPPGFPDAPVAILHAGSGALILVLMLLRIVLRLRYGAPPLPADMSPLLKVIAHVDHYALYATLVLLPLTGVLALYVFSAAAGLHQLLKTLLIALVALHVLGALYHAVARDDGVFQRMLSWPPRR